LRFNEVVQMAEDVSEDDAGRRRRRRRRRRKSDSSLERTQAALTPAPVARSSITVEFAGIPVIAAGVGPQTVDALVALPAFKTAVISLMAPEMARRLSFLVELSETLNTAVTVNAALVAKMTLLAVKLPNVVQPNSLMEMERRTGFRIEIGWPDDAGWVKSSRGPPTAAQLKALWATPDFTTALSGIFTAATAAGQSMRVYGATDVSGVTAALTSNIFMVGSFTIRSTLQPPSTGPPTAAAATAIQFRNPNDNTWEQDQAVARRGDYHYRFVDLLAKGLNTCFQIGDVKGAQISVLSVEGNMIRLYYTNIQFHFLLTFDNVPSAFGVVEDGLRSIEAAATGLLWRSTLKQHAATVLKVPIGSLRGNALNGVVQNAQNGAPNVAAVDGRISCVRDGVQDAATPRVCQYDISYVAPGAPTNGVNDVVRGAVGEVFGWMSANNDVDGDGQGDVGEAQARWMTLVRANLPTLPVPVAPAGGTGRILAIADIAANGGLAQPADTASDRLVGTAGRACLDNAGDCGDVPVADFGDGEAYFHVRYRIDLQAGAFPNNAVKVRDWATRTTAYTSWGTSMVSAMRSPELLELGMSPLSAEANGLVTAADIEDLR